MSNLKALLFDLDGTLIDSEYFHFECWNELMGEFGVTLTYDDWIKNYAGIPLPVNTKTLVEKYHIDTPLQALIDKREALTLTRLKTATIKLMPHVGETMDFFVKKGLRMALVTSSPRQDVVFILERTGLAKYFELIITRSDVTHSKPHPESYNTCVEKLGLAKKECIVFEDTINGLKAAKAAGLVCYVVQSNTEEHDKLAAADQLFLNFRDAKDYMIANELV